MHGDRIAIGAIGFEATGGGVVFQIGDVSVRFVRSSELLASLS